MSWKLCPLHSSPLVPPRARTRYFQPVDFRWGHWFTEADVLTTAQQTRPAPLSRTLSSQSFCSSHPRRGKNSVWTLFPTARRMLFAVEKSILMRWVGGLVGDKWLFCLRMKKWPFKGRHWPAFDSPQAPALVVSTECLVPAIPPPGTNEGPPAAREALPSETLPYPQGVDSYESGPHRSPSQERLSPNLDLWAWSQGLCCQVGAGVSEMKWLLWKTGQNPEIAPLPMEKCLWQRQHQTLWGKNGDFTVRVRKTGEPFGSRNNGAFILCTRLHYRGTGVTVKCRNETIQELKGNMGKFFSNFGVGKAFLILTQHPEIIRGKINKFQEI